MNIVAMRLLSTAVAVVALFWLGMSDAKAQYDYYANEGAAYEACQVAIEVGIAGAPSYRPISRNADSCKKFANANSPFFRSTYAWTNTDTGQSGTGYYGDFYYRLADTCATMPAKTSGFFSSSSMTFCSGGCAFAREANQPAITIGGRTYHSGIGATPTGATCAHGSGDGPGVVSNDDCQQAGTLTQCVKPDGRQCAVSSTGKQFCWQPTEAGIKASGNEAATKAPTNASINPPANPPKNGGDWAQTGQGTSATTSGGTTNNYTVTNWTSSYGSGGNGGGAEGEGDGEGDGHGSPGEGVGDLYTPTDKTVASVFQAFRERVGESPIVSAIDSFMTVSVGGGCPVFTVPASDYWSAMTWDAHCSGAFAQALVSIGWVLMAIAAFFAFKMAIS